MPRVASSARSLAPAVRRAARRHPEWSAAAAIGAAWTILVVLQGHAAGPALAAGGSHGTPGPQAPRGDGPIAALATLPLWIVMTVGMMVPATLPAVRHVGMNSLRWRRQRAVGEFLAAYVGVWAVFGLLALGALALAEGRVARDALLAATLAVAAVWQLLPFQRRFLRACHRTVPIPPTGWRAAAGCARFGLRHGRACLGACWPLMLVMAAVVHGGVLWMLALTAVVSAKRLLPRSDRMSRPLAAGLAAAAVAFLALAPAGASHADAPVRAAPDGAGGVTDAPQAPLWLCRW